MSNKKSEEISSRRDFLISWWTERGAHLLALSGVSRYYLVCRRDSVALAPGLFNFLGEDGAAWLFWRKQSCDVSAKLHRVLVVHPSVRHCPPSSRTTRRILVAKDGGTCSTCHVGHAPSVTGERHVSRKPHLTPLPLFRALSTDCAESLGASSPRLKPRMHAMRTPIGELHGKDSWIPNTRRSLSRILKYRVYFSIVSLQY